MSESNLIPTETSGNEVYELIRTTLSEARRKVVVAANTEMVGVYWEIGRYINEAVGERAEYGRSLLAFLSERLTAEFGKGYYSSNENYPLLTKSIQMNRMLLKSILDKK